MILRLATANENGRRGARRHVVVGAALCGRPSFPRRGAPTDCKVLEFSQSSPAATQKPHRRDAEYAERDLANNDK